MREVTQVATRPTVWQLKKTRRVAWRKLGQAEKYLMSTKSELRAVQAECRERLAFLHRIRIEISVELDEVFLLEDRILEEGVYWEMHEVERRFKTLYRRLRKISHKISLLNVRLRRAHRKVRDARRQLGRTRLRYLAAKHQVWRATAHLYAPIVPWSKKQEVAKAIRVPVEYRSNLHVVICQSVVHVYFGGERFPTDDGHGHYVMEDGFVTYRRDPGVPHGDGRLEVEWGRLESDCL